MAQTQDKARAVDTLVSEMKAVAEAATPGPWFAEDWNIDDGPSLTTVAQHYPEVLGTGQSGIWPDGIAKHRVAETEEGISPLEDARFIALANPANVLTLLAEIERLKSSRENYASAKHQEIVSLSAKQVECLDENALGDLLDFANRVQARSWRGGRRTPRFGTFQQAATALGVSVELIALAVEAHYWMFADDPSAPIGERQIEHEGE